MDCRTGLLRGSLDSGGGLELAAWGHAQLWRCRRPSAHCAAGLRVIPSALAYLAGCAGFYRLARRWLGPAAAALALAFFAANPNLLYLQTTAMGEPLFVCETIWIALWLVEWRGALETDPRRANRLQGWIAGALVAAVFTRYDGWAMALLAWVAVGLTLARRGSGGSRAGGVVHL